jgi:sugar/nucleoside kinase (ribokinase family)
MTQGQAPARVIVAGSLNLDLVLTVPRLPAALVDAGVDAAAVRVEPGEASGRAMVTVDDRGANCIVVVSGANSLVGSDHVTSVPFTAGDVLVA